MDKNYMMSSPRVFRSVMLCIIGWIKFVDYLCQMWYDIAGVSE